VDHSPHAAGKLAAYTLTLSYRGPRCHRTSPRHDPKDQTQLSPWRACSAFYCDRSPRYDTILMDISALGIKLGASVKKGAIVEDVAEVG
jgi:hypothetical protein